MNIATEIIDLGESKRIDLPVSVLTTGSSLTMPLQVVRGMVDGPTLCIVSTIHGDEINGIEIIRQVLETIQVETLRGTIIAAPIVNIFGFLNEERYLPDRRDLNRSFPGSKRGSMAGQLAHMVMTEIISHADVVLDLHTGSNHRSNLPQIRANLKDPQTLKLAKAFSSPVLIDSKAREGSLRATVGKKGIPVLAYEGGETQRFNQDAIEYGVKGTLNIISQLKMRTEKVEKQKSIITTDSHWIRANKSGLFRSEVVLGQKVKEQVSLGIISDPLGARARAVMNKYSGVVIGITVKPQVNKGDALVHIATL